jgi:hypothetical protein
LNLKYLRVYVEKIMKKMTKIIGTLSLFGLLVSCGTPTRFLPVLAERGVAPVEREFHAKQEGYGIDRKILKTFQKGYIEEGMTQRMVSLLWGPANREFKNGEVWEYTDQAGNVITTVHFDDTKKLIGEVHRLVTQIKGDRYGGTPAPK